MCCVRRVHVRPLHKRNVDIFFWGDFSLGGVTRPFLLGVHSTRAWGGGKVGQIWKENDRCPRNQLWCIREGGRGTSGSLPSLLALLLSKICQGLEEK